jgi:hypothetical protein
MSIFQLAYSNSTELANLTQILLFEFTGLN